MPKKKQTKPTEQPVTDIQPKPPVITIQSITNTQDTEDSLFSTMKRRREKEH